MDGKKLRFKIIEQFLADGMNVMFGNPGTVEQGFLDALVDYPQMKYILTLQESIAVLAGDAYARSKQSATLVQIHSTPGLGNAIGAMYQAYRGHSPLVVIGGDAGVKYLNMDAQMAGDLVAMAKPVTKWSTVIYDSKTALRTIRKAVKIASTPPMGPVYICLPMDVLDEVCVEDVFPASIPSTNIIPDDNTIVNIAQSIIKSQNPKIYIGDGVAYSNATEEVSKLALLIGAEIYNVDGGDLNVSWQDPLFKGQTGHMFGYASLPIFKSGDLNLIVGTYVAPEVFPELGDIFDKDAVNIHIDLNAYEIAKNHPVDIGVVSNPKLTLEKIIGKINELISPEFVENAKQRVNSISESKTENINKQIEADKAKFGSTPLHFEEFSLALSQHLDNNTIIFDEALTNSPALTRYNTPKEAGNFFQTRGGSLGVGLPGGIGLKIANPDKNVIVIAGDGGSMYTIQALWTALRHNVNVKYIICNNASYHLLQLNIDAYWQEREMNKHDFPLPFDLSNPPLNFKAIAESMGVRAARVEQSWQIEGAIKEMLEHNGPFLIDLVLESSVRPKKLESIADNNEENMIHQFIFAAPKPGMSEKDFQDYWLNYHAVKFASNIIEIKKYLIDLRIETKFDNGEPLYSGIAEIWLNNDEEQLASLQSAPFLQGARLDEPNWAAFWKTLVLDTDLAYENNAELTSSVVKVVLIAKRKNGVELKDFRNFALNTHIPKLEQIEGIKKIRLNFTRDGWYYLGEPRFDLVASLWFESLEAMYNVFENDKNGVCNFKDADFVNPEYVFNFFVNENWVIGPDKRD